MQQEMFDFYAPTNRAVESEIVLRPYQHEAIRRSYEAFKEGTNKQLIVLPTGAGKTVVVGKMLDAFDFPSMLMLAHREELLTQAKDRISELYPDLKVQIEQADKSVDHDCNIVIASVQSIGRTGSKRIEKFNPDRFPLIVVDEAHHATASTYLNILKYFNINLLVGVTATPGRGDNVKLSNVFDEVVFSRDLIELTLEGEADLKHGPYLCRLRGGTVETGVDLSGVSVNSGDYADNELSQLCNTDVRNSKIISAIEKHATDRKSILVFCVDTDHVTTLTEQLIKAGHRAEFITHKTPSVERFRTIQRFRKLETRILVNCGIATEGFDAPQIDCVVLARPTRSQLLYQQMIGRATRCYPGKEYSLVIDVCDMFGKFPPRSISDMFGVRSLDLLGQDVIEASKVVKEAQQMGVSTDDCETIKDVEKRLELARGITRNAIYIDTKIKFVDMFNAFSTPKEVEQFSEYTWIKVAPSTYLLHMMDDGIINLSCDNLNRWTVTKGETSFTYSKATEIAPFKWADNKIGKFYNFRDCMATKANAKWKMQPASDKQKALLRNRYRIFTVPDDLTKGAAGDIMDRIEMMKFWENEKKNTIQEK